MSDVQTIMGSVGGVAVFLVSVWGITVCYRHKLKHGQGQNWLGDGRQYPAAPPQYYPAPEPAHHARGLHEAHPPAHAPAPQRFEISWATGHDKHGGPDKRPEHPAPQAASFLHPFGAAGHEAAPHSTVHAQAPHNTTPHPSVHAIAPHHSVTHGGSNVLPHDWKTNPNFSHVVGHSRYNGPHISR
jgi:hypothetical protein